MSDVTPHESVPFAEAAHRQYFRVVTSSVSVWYSKHSTANPLGITPDLSITRRCHRRACFWRQHMGASRSVCTFPQGPARILHGDKFEEAKPTFGAGSEKTDSLWDVYKEYLGEGMEGELLAQHLE